MSGAALKCRDNGRSQSQVQCDGLAGRVAATTPATPATPATVVITMAVVRPADPPVAAAVPAAAPAVAAVVAADALASTPVTVAPAATGTGALVPMICPAALTTSTA